MLLMLGGPLQESLCLLSALRGLHKQAMFIRNWKKRDPDDPDPPPLDVSKLAKRWWPAALTVLVAALAVLAGYTHRTLNAKPAFEPIGRHIWRYPLGWRWLNAIYTPLWARKLALAAAKLRAELCALAGL